MLNNYNTILKNLITFLILNYYFTGKKFIRLINRYKVYVPLFLNHIATLEIKILKLIIHSSTIKELLLSIFTIK